MKQRNTVKRKLRNSRRKYRNSRRGGAVVAVQKGLKSAVNFVGLGAQKKKSPIVLKTKVKQNELPSSPNSALNERDVSEFKCSDDYLMSSDTGFSCDKSLGKGNFGVVCGCHLKGNPNKYYAVKFLNEKDAAIEHNSLTLIKNLIDRNPNIGNYLLNYYPELSKGAFERAVVTEYMDGGSLKDHIENQESNILSSPEKIKDVAKKAYTGMNMLHTGGLVHLDIAPRNVLVSLKDTTRNNTRNTTRNNTRNTTRNNTRNNTRIKLADFGNSRPMADLQTGLKVPLNTQIEPNDLRKNSSKYMGENACFIDYYALSLLILGLIHKKIVTNKTYCNLNTLDKVLGDMSVQARGILDYIESLTSEELSSNKEKVKNTLARMVE